MNKYICGVLVFCSLNYGPGPYVPAPPSWTKPFNSQEFLDNMMKNSLSRFNQPEDAKRYAKFFSAEKYGWGASQFSCLNTLWTKESNWRWNSVNKSSGASGIPQRLPGDHPIPTKWRSSAKLQVQWGLNYIKKRYSTPCGAWGAFQAKGWY